MVAFVFQAAFSVSDKVQTVGALAGFAAILGLGVLSVLYFGQAREVRRLREWAGRAPERAAEMQERVGAQATGAGAVRRAAAPQQPLVPQRPSPQQPATPGAVAARRPGTVPPATPPVTPGTVPAAGAAAAAAGAAAGAATRPPAAGTVPPATVPPAATPPATGASPNGPTATPPAAPPRDTSDQATAFQPAIEDDDDTGARPAVPLRSASAMRASSARPAPEEPEQRSSTIGATIAIVGAVVVIVVAALFLTGVLGGGGSNSSNTGSVIAPKTQTKPTTSSASSTPATTTPAPNRAQMSIVVLNGTNGNGAARGIAGTLTAKGYKAPLTGNHNSPTGPLAKTVVAYTPGNQAAARLVAKSLTVAGVSALDASTQADALQAQKDNGLTPGNVDVVVTVGTDKAPTQ